ncbi:MAG: helix-turn-helix transcriptional regulator [Candidatus Shapirobacteria bacterium]|nr:helix-turn-helix transcriptional regulator [Candidatus Shapirobacteria bacterium]
MQGYKKDNPYQRERKVLGQTIKRLRENVGITQEDLADKAHVNVSYLAKIETGYVNTTVRYLIKIARGLGVSVKELFEF